MFVLIFSQEIALSIHKKLLTDLSKWVKISSTIFMEECIIHRRITVAQVKNTMKTTNWSSPLIKNLYFKEFN